MSKSNTTPEQPKPLSASSLASSLNDKSEIKKFISRLSQSQLEELSHDWNFLARSDQKPPEFLPGTTTKWNYWLFLAGRGAGKTRSGAEWIREQVKSGAKRLAFIAPTAGDIRDVMVEGSSGILSCSWDKDRDIHGASMGVPEYEPSKRHQLTWKNGAIAHGYSAEEPDRLRGPQHEAIWCDELAAWQYAQETWDMAMFGLRLGDHPQAMISTTPRPIPLVRELIRSPLSVITKSSTFANRANLAASFIHSIITKYEGTRLGRQELLGELIEELEGALWKRLDIEQALLPVHSKHHDFKRVVVAVDPAITENPTSNLTGIVAAALGSDDHGYVLSDRSGRYSPQAWATTAIAMYHEYKADAIVAEGNQGGDMVRHTIQTVMPNAPVRIVHASRSKQARAEPVSALYEQRRVHHVTSFPELEDQMCTWEPLSGDPSPDRLDALVWALTDWMLSHHLTDFAIPFVWGVPRNVPGN
jgi:phage terminase large subunit-like protein